MTFNLGDFRNKFGCEWLDEFGILLDLLGCDETVCGERDCCVYPFIMLAERGSTKHSARYTSNKLCKSVGNHHLSPVYLINIWKV